MKLITSFVGIVALTFVISALAQEEETAAPTPEEKASTTVEETPTPTPGAKTATTPAVQPTAQKEKPAAAGAPKKSAPPAAVTSGKKISVEAALKDNENHWEAAIARHDTASVESMVAEDFIGVSSRPGAKVQNRRGLLGEMKGDKDTYTSTKNEKLDVHMYGNGVAVVVGTTREKGTGKDGKAFDRTYRFTDTWMERSGKWVCVASQASLVAQK